jgi:hypothetical protein
MGTGYWLEGFNIFAPDLLVTSVSRDKKVALFVTVAAPGVFD